MIKLLGGIDLEKYTPREYIVANTDLMSIEKIKQFETDNKSFTINSIYRSRNVGQSYFSSVLTTLIALLNAIPLIFKLKTNLLLVNGPGTCLPLCIIYYIYSKIFFCRNNRIIFIESICRVKTLSLTGKILYYLNLTDSFIVQWPDLQYKYKKAIYLGRLI
jgi:beta-1,4-N-acetylglucosaminyltransferase